MKVHEVQYPLETHISKLSSFRFIYAGLKISEFRPSLFAMPLYFTSRMPTRLLAMVSVPSLDDFIGYWIFPVSC